MVAQSLVDLGVVLGMFAVRVVAPMALMFAVCLWVKRRCECATC
jgi:hypothetical protein